MRPPECYICGKDFRDEDTGGLVYFKKRPSDEEWIKEMEEKQLTGHPPFAEWFCAEHYDLAKKLEHLTIDEALKLMKKA